MWAFGTAARRAPEDWMRQSAHVVLRPRARATLAVAAGDGVRRARRGRGARRPSRATVGARELLADAVDDDRPPATDPTWPWPEPRLTYANAVLPEALIAAGHLPRSARRARRRARRLLRWLLDRETSTATCRRPGRRCRSRRPRADVRPTTDRGRRDGRRVRSRLRGHRR